MSTLGDHFPLHVLRQVADERLRAGQILYLDVEHSVSGRSNKYMLLAARCQPPILFFINSEIPQMYRLHHTERIPLQVRLKASQYAFLSHDSWIDCSDAISADDYELEIAEQIISSRGQIVGCLSRATLNQVIGVVKKAFTLSEREKVSIVDALSQ